MAIRSLARHERPHAFILGGDFVEHAAALPMLDLLVRCLARIAPCVALPGNHDMGLFRERVPDIIRRAGGHWLPDTGRFEITNGDDRLLEIVTRGAASGQSSATRLVAVHDPAELDDNPPTMRSWVMAGHLHGGQWVLSSKGGKLLPAAWFYQHAWLRRQHVGSEWIVSRGAGDTFPLRWNCPREVVLCEIP
ncbi:MAG: hypothetical protein EOP85_07460 [Verrucomicrobiaceae bacterium]|nr:MAG: hypothetical protein EOP85_07460 [Verrucomicrobiaceae bacterium]